MRKEYGKVLRDYFTQRMKQVLPRFEPIKYAGNMYIWPGERVYRWVAEEPMHCFVILSPSPKGHDEFTVEIGWSTLGRFPELSARGINRPTPDRSEFDKAEFICRLSWLVSGADDWWVISSFSIAGFTDPSDALLDAIKPVSTAAAKTAVIPSVDNAIQKLVDYGIPYLEEFVGHVAHR